LNALTGGRLTGFVDAAKDQKAKGDMTGFNDTHTKPNHESGGKQQNGSAHKEVKPQQQNGSAHKETTPQKSASPAPAKATKASGAEHAQGNATGGTKRATGSE